MSKEFQDLPLEVAVRILGYLKLEELVNLNRECLLLRKAVSMIVRHTLVITKRKIDSEIENMWRQCLQLHNNYNIYSYGLNKILKFSLINMEVNHLYQMLWRHVDNLHAWSYLARILPPVFEDINFEIDNIENCFFFSTNLAKNPNLNHFIQVYDEQIETKFLNDSHSNLLVKVVDVLTLSSCGNYRIIFNTNENELVENIQMDFELKNIYYPVHIPHVKEEEDSIKLGRMILKYLRGYIRFSNEVYVRESQQIYSDLTLNSLHNFKMKLLQKNAIMEFKPNMKVYQLGENMKQYVFTKNTFYNLSNNDLFCKISVKCDLEGPQPASFKKIYNDSVKNSQDEEHLFDWFRLSRNLNKLDLTIIENDSKLKCNKQFRWVYNSIINRVVNKWITSHY